MNSPSTSWITPLALVYILLANIALAWGSRPIAATAICLLAVLVVLAIRGPRAPAWRTLVAAAGIWLAQGVVRGSLPPLPLLLPPVVVPAALAWMFGHTLVGKRVALVERFARAVHAPEPIDDRHAAYARGVTVMWTVCLIAMALGNLLLVMSLVPGGLLDLLGLQAPWTLDRSAFLWLSNAAYLLIVAVFVAEFLFRLWRFPSYRLRNPVEFMRRARERLPAVIEALRRE